MTFFLGALWLLANGLADSLPLLCAAALHEAGHAAACLCLKIRIRFFAPSPFGAVIGYDPLGVSYRAEAILALAGPGAGLLGCAAASHLPGRFWTLFCLSSLSLSLFNLLPIRPLDGFVFWQAVLDSALDPLRGEKILSAVSGAGTVLLWMFAAAVQMRCGGNLSLLLLSVAMMMSLAGSR